jgi:hypothetical protein
MRGMCCCVCVVDKSLCLREKGVGGCDQRAWWSNVALWTPPFCSKGLSVAKQSDEFWKRSARGCGKQTNEAARKKDRRRAPIE